MDFIKKNMKALLFVSAGMLVIGIQWSYSKPGSGGSGALLLVGMLVFFACLIVEAIEVVKARKQQIAGEAVASKEAGK